MTLAGANAVFTPRHVLGAALAARASSRVSPRLAGIQKLGRRLEVSEIRIEHGSSLAGRTLAESELGARTGATVIGVWTGGKLVAPPTADMRLAATGILVVVGSEDSVARVTELCGGVTPLRQKGPFLVGGFGEVGQKVVQLLQDAGEQVRVVDRVAAEGVDVVGDMLDPRILEEADVRSAQAVILALDTDTATLFATVILKDLAPAVSVIARVNQAENVERIHRAGADFALSISQVSGQILARRLLGEEGVSVDPQLKVVKASAAALAGRHPSELQIRERTRASVVAVERGEEVFVELGPDFRFEPEDTVYVCGSSTAVRRFQEEFGSERAVA
jgi:Trk K+ transport system NAD-binding subunit